MPLPELAFGDDFPESFYVSSLPFPPFGLPVRVPHTTTPLLPPPLPFPTTPPDRPLPPPPSTAATATSWLYPCRYCRPPHRANCLLHLF